MDMNDINIELTEEELYEIQYRNKLWKNVQRGVKFLDKENPGWHNLVQLGDLDMRNGSQCICGWVFRGLVDQLNAVHQEEFGYDVVSNGYDAFQSHYTDRSGASLGFEAPNSYSVHKDYSILTELWVEVIEKRLANDGKLA